VRWKRIIGRPAYSPRPHLPNLIASPRRPQGARTVDALRLNVCVRVRYHAAWLAGSGSVLLYNLMEDAATAGISRVRHWQWLRHGTTLDASSVEVRTTPELSPASSRRRWRGLRQRSVTRGSETVQALNTCAHAFVGTVESPFRNKFRNRPYFDGCIRQRGKA